MAKDDRDHFREYTPQNRIKHEILAKYFGAYMIALGRRAGAFHYVDGFAGPGVYEERHRGSPFIALALLASQMQPFSVSFIEKDHELFVALHDAMSKQARPPNLFEEPFLRQGEFKDYVGDILSRRIYREYQNVATFAFVDPCGVQGVRMCDLAALLGQQYGECLLFWNYDGLNRWLGGVAHGTHSIGGIVELFGDEGSANEALRICSADRPDKETQLRDLFLTALRQRSNATHILPFRFEAKSSERTSHYIVHCSRHGLAFKIMKDVMDRASSAEDEGTFEFLSAGETNYQMGFFRPRFDRARAEILEYLARQNAHVDTFTDEWVRRPGDLLSSNGYKRILLDLEESSQIEIWDAEGTRPMPRENRRKYFGRPTLGESYLVRLKR